MNPVGSWTLISAAWLLLLVGLGGQATSQTQRNAEDEKIKTIIESFDGALSARDMGAVESIWAHEPYVVVISPRDKSFSLGWQAVKRHWEDVFLFWSYLKVSMIEEPRVHVIDNMAWASSIMNAEGQLRQGGPLAFTYFVTDVFEKRGDRWLMVAHHASRIPE